MERRPVPEPSAGEMLLRLRVVGFCGTDLFKLTTGTAAVGTVLGHEVVGEVIKLGDGVSKFHVGDRVAVPHHVPCGKCVLCQRGYETMCESFQENLMEPGGFADNILMRPRATELAARVGLRRRGGRCRMQWWSRHLFECLEEVGEECEGWGPWLESRLQPKY